MAGLFGSGFDDPQSAANMALAAGLISGNFGAGLLGANAAYREATNDQVKRRALEADMAERLSHAEERKAKMELARRDQDFQQRLLYGDMPSVTPGASPGAAAPAGGGFGAAQAPSGGGGLIAQARALGIPETVIQADVAFNGGKKLSEILDKRSTPNWQNINGNLVNTNAQGFQGGLQAGMSAGNDGRVTAWQPDGRGSVVVGAPTGALETFGAYNRVGAASKPIKVFNPATQRDEYTSEADVTAPRQPQVQQSRLPAQPGVNGNFSGDPTPIMEAITQIRDPQERANAMAAFQEQARRTQGFAGGGGFPAGPSTSEAAAAAGAKVKAEADAKAGSEREATFAKGAANSKDTLNYIREARELFKKGPTASGLGAAIDAGAGLIGMSTPGADAAAQLDTLSGWMVSNVPRMEGPQSNFDVQNYKTMAAMVGDRTKPLSQRLAALDTLERLQQKYSHLNADAPANDGGTDRKPTALALPSNPDAKSLKTGQAYTLPNGKQGVWDGFRFKVTQ
jgi:hypothetical protein